MRALLPVLLFASVACAGNPVGPPRRDAGDDTGPSDGAAQDASGVDAGCRGGTCPLGQRCNAITGRCEMVSEACREVTCDPGELCVDGACLADADGDGSPEGEDCDDSDASVFPGASEECNARDDDCDGEVDEEAGCGCDRKVRDGHTYLFCEEAETWDDARDECMDRGYDLVILETSDEEDWLRDETGPHNYWLGLTDREEEGVYRWVDGTRKDESTIEWGTNEFAPGQDCIIMRRDGDRRGNFHDRECSDEYFYVCETG